MQKQTDTETLMCLKNKTLWLLLILNEHLAQKNRIIWAYLPLTPCLNWTFDAIMKTVFYAAKSCRWNTTFNIVSI